MNQPYWLVAVIGMTPQIITETLYALLQQGRGLPQAIKIITTAKGKERARLELIVNARLAQFCQDYQQPLIPFAEEDIYAAPDHQGNPVDDARNSQDHNALADFISNKVREWVAQSPALHASIAGGRKTMTFYLGYAMSLFGRAQDSLSHVLVNAEYESSSDFFYPTPYSKVVYGRERQPLDAAKAEVTLVDIPFVRLNGLFKHKSKHQAHSFAEIVASYNQPDAEPSLVFDLTQLKVFAHGVDLALKPSEVLFYEFIYRCGGSSNSDEVREYNAREYLRREAERCDINPTLPLPQLVAALKEKIGACDRQRNCRLRENSLESLAQGMAAHVFDSRKKGIHDKLRQKLPTTVQEQYFIDSVDSQDTGSGNNRDINIWGLTLAAHYIHYQ